MKYFLVYCMACMFSFLIALVVSVKLELTPFWSVGLFLVLLVLVSVVCEYLHAKFSED